MMNLTQMTDEQLAIAYVDGDNRAFDLLLSRNQSKLYSYIMYVVQNRATADDVFQDTFVKAISKMRQGQYSASGKFSSWLIRIAHNVIIDMYRDQKQENVVELPCDNDLSAVGLVEGNVENVFVNDQTSKEVVMLMEALPANQREVVYMRFFQQLSFKEIADTLGISINTALGRMRYAVLNMRKLANQYQVAI